MGLDQTQPPFFPILDIEMARIMDGRPFAKGGVIPNPSAWPPEAFKVSNGAVYLTSETVERYGAGILSAMNQPTAVPDATFLRTWAANIADDAKEPSQDA